MAKRDYTPITFNKKGNCTYVDWAQDTIFFNFPTTRTPLEPVCSLFTELRKAQSLAITIKTLPGPNFLDLLSTFNQLRDLLIVDDIVYGVLLEQENRNRQRPGITRNILAALHGLYSKHIADNIDKHPHLCNVQMSVVKRNWKESGGERFSCPLKKHNGLVDSFIADLHGWNDQGGRIYVYNLYRDLSVVSTYEV